MPNTSTTKKVAKKTPAKKATKVAKAPVKKATKKAAKKTTATNKKAGKVLVCAQASECFWTTDGSVLRDLRELEQALHTMTAKVYKYHVQKERNDFAQWVEHVLKDSGCAAALERAKTPKTAHTVVVRHLKLYQL